MNAKPAVTAHEADPLAALSDKQVLTILRGKPRPSGLGRMAPRC